MNNVPVHDDSAGFAAKLADATAEPWCNHDTAALDAEGVCECGSTLSQRMVAMLEDELSRDDSSAAEIAADLEAEARRSLRPASESDGCTCCQVSTESTRADEDECPRCGHLMSSHYRAHEYSEEPDAELPHLTRAHCSCGWHSSGYSKIARLFWEGHLSAAAAS
jgi:hypothetical protein